MSSGWPKSLRGMSAPSWNRRLSTRCITASREHREFGTGDISDAIRRQVPLSVSQRERIQELRRWLHEGRAQSASFHEAGEAERHFVALPTGPRGRRKRL